MNTVGRLLASGSIVAALAACGGAAQAAAVPAPAGSSAKEDDVFTKCAVKTPGGLVIRKDKFQALADNLTDSEFAKFDTACRGKRNNPEAVAKASRKKQREAERVAQGIRDEAAGRATAPGTVPPLPVEVARAEFGAPAELDLPVLFRDAYSNYSLLNAPPAKERATGTQISYTRDYLTDNDIVSAKGAIIAWKTFDVPADSPWSQWGATRTLFAPGVEFDQVRNQNDPKKNNDYISFKLITEIEKEAPGTVAPLQFLRLAGYWKTDSRGDSRIVGGYAQWEPVNLDYGIGVAPRLFGTPLQFRWSPVLHAEAEKVIDAGMLTTVATGDTYVRFGPIVSADVFFAEGPLQRLVLNAQYRYLWNVTEVTPSKDIRYFQSSAAYNVDSAGNIALSITYRDGITPGNSTRVQDLKTGLTIKY